jgi:catechol 2,3-dioxygenase-like lactoylglutathione lyase family enzyme
MPLGHLGINVADLGAARAYYDEVMPLLGYEPYLSAEHEIAYLPADGKRGTFIFMYPAVEPGEYSRERSGLQRLAFMVRTRTDVRAVHDHVVAGGGTVLHAAREFTEYPPPYLATFWLDPFGTMRAGVGQCPGRVARGRDGENRGGSGSGSAVSPGAGGSGSGIGGPSGRPPWVTGLNIGRADVPTSSS